MRNMDLLRGDRPPLFTVKLSDVVIPSTNKKYKSHPSYLTHKEHLKYLFELAKIKHDKIEFPLVGDLKVDLHIISKKDLDNCLKGCFDALTQSRVIVDDVQIVQSKINIHRPRYSDEKESLILEIYS
jgi:Holliday junction resolvase RusA-like endonuclease